MQGNQKILVLLTGGTIGSSVQNQIINVRGESPYQLLRMYEEQVGRESFAVECPMQILSENMTGDTLQRLLSYVSEIDQDDYAGIIITHGSDTLSYTAAFMSILFQNTKIPMILIAGNYPPEDPRSNGLANFKAAVQLIRSQKKAGVFVVYRDKTGRMPVYAGGTICEADPVYDDFHDFYGTPLGYMEEEKFVSCKKKDDGEKHSRYKCAVPASFAKNVLLIRPYPMMNYDFVHFSKEKKPAAVLHNLYHSATACTAGENTSFLQFAARCREHGIPIFTASHKSQSGAVYASAAAMKQEGIYPLCNCSAELAYALLLLSYNGPSELTDEEIWQHLNKFLTHV